MSIHIYLIHIEFYFLIQISRCGQIVWLLYFSSFLFLTFVIVIDDLLIVFAHFTNSIIIILDVEIEEYESFSFVMSRRGKPQLYYQGYLFNSDGVKNGRVYWRCSETRRGTCMARVLTTQHSLLEKQPRHDHEPNTARVHGKKFLSLRECYLFFKSTKSETKQLSNISEH